MTDTYGNPVYGINITFTAPASDASAIFSNSTNTITVATDGQGRASATITATAVDGSYSVTAAASGVPRQSFSLTNRTLSPAVLTNPLSQSISAGSQVTFTASASGTPTPTVQWQISTDGDANFVNITGATSTTLSFTTTAGQNGNEYQAVFTNSAGTATTTAATLTVYAAPSVSVTDVGGVYTGKPYAATGSVTASGQTIDTPTFTYYVYNTATQTLGQQLAAAPTDVGSYAVVASFAGLANYLPSSSQAIFTITPASAR